MTHGVWERFWERVCALTIIDDEGAMLEELQGLVD